MNKKKVLVISYVFSLSNTVRAYAVYKALKHDYQTSVLYANYDHYSKRYLTYDNTDFMSVHVPAYRKNLSIMRLVSVVTFGIRTLKSIKDLSPDIVYVICPPNTGSYFASRLCKQKGILCLVDIVDLHPESIPINSTLKRLGKFFGLFLWKKFRDLAIRNASKVIVECDYYRKAIDEKHSYKISTVYLTKQTVNTKVSFNKLEERLINIVYLGSIGYIYDFDTLLELGQQLMEKNVGVKLHIIGDGERRAWLIDQLAKRSLPYEYYGKVYDESIKKDIMEFCDFGFNGFKDETSVGLSYKSIDYMDYGLAIINSAKEDTWNLVKEYRAGVNYCPNDVGSLTNRILSLNKSEIVEMKKNSRRLFETFFATDIFNRKIQELIDGLASIQR